MLRTLVISGANTGMFYMLGVLYQALGRLSSVTHCYGTSAGSLVCCMYLIHKNRLFCGCQDHGPQCFVRLYETAIGFLHRYKWVAHVRGGGYGVFDIEQLMKELLKCLHIAENFTMSGFKEGKLHTTAYCVNTCRTVVHSSTTDPDLPLWKALSMSCCVPLMFKPVVHRNMYHVDGSILEYVPRPDRDAPGETLRIIMDWRVTDGGVGWFVNNIVFANVRQSCRLHSDKQMDYTLFVVGDPNAPQIISSCTHAEVTRMIESGRWQWLNWVGLRG